MHLRPNLLKEADYQRVIFECTLEAGTTYDDVFKPSFWAHVARKLKPNSRIEVHPHDYAWFAELIVLSKTHVSAVVAELRKVEFKKARKSADSLGNYEIKFRGPRKWSAIDKTSKEPVVEDMESEQAVIDWLNRPQTAAVAA